MKVSVYLGAEGMMDVLVQSSPGKGRSPVVLPAITPSNVVARVGPVVEEMRTRKRPKLPQLSF